MLSNLTLIAVVLGGAGGALARFGVQQFVATRTRFDGWIAILAINVLGSLLIGFAVGQLDEELRHLALGTLDPGSRSFESTSLRELFAIVTVGFCGAFTTYSTFALDNVLLGIERPRLAWVNTVASITLSFLAVAAGWQFGGLVAGS